MESYYNLFRIIVIVTVSTWVTIFISPVDASDSFFAARSLLSEPESPAPAPDVMSPISSTASSPTEEDIESPAPAPEALDVSNSPANSPTEMESYSAVEAPSVEPSSPIAVSELNLMNAANNLLNPETKTICSKTDNPLLCESSVSPLLTAHFKADASSVLVLAIEASINATKAALATVKKVAAADCQELYEDAVTNLEDAVKAIKSRDIGTLNTNLSDAMTDYGTCNDGFEESGEPNPLSNISDKLTKMVSNCLALSTLIK